MAHSFANLLVHVIFGTKERYPFIGDALAGRLWPYLGGIAREMQAVPLAVGGRPDHVHLLVRVPAALCVADFVRVVKANATRWVHETFAEQRKFAWQAGYGAFSVSASNATAAREYVLHQAEHHRQMTFEQEYVAFLERHGIAYESRYVWE